MAKSSRGLIAVNNISNSSKNNNFNTFTNLGLNNHIVSGRVISNVLDETHTRFVELGSWKGKSSSYMAVEIANSGKKIKFDCVDTWEDWSGDGFIYTAMERFDNMKSLYTHIDKLHMRGDEASKMFPDEHFDLVYIDVSHWYDDVINDINTWLPKIKHGGYLTGHD